MAGVCVRRGCSHDSRVLYLPYRHEQNQAPDTGTNAHKPTFCNLFQVREESQGRQCFHRPPSTTTFRLLFSSNELPFCVLYPASGGLSTGMCQKMVQWYPHGLLNRDAAMRGLPLTTWLWRALHHSPQLRQGTCGCEVFSSELCS